MTVTSAPALSPPATYPACSDPGYVMTLSLGGSDYQVFAHIEEANGTKTYLPSTCDPQVFEKIRGLTWGLLNAHDARRTSLREAPYELKSLDQRGVVKADNAIVSHDFLIQPVSTLIADQMASAISLAGHPMQATAVKAQDVWTTMEEMIRREMGRASNPATPDPTPPTPTQPDPQPLAQTPESNPSNTAAPNAMSPPRYQPPITATGLNLRGFNFEQPDWYEQMPDRTKLRIITDILENRCPVGGVYEKVWKLFEMKVHDHPSSTILTLLSEEKTRLSNRCRALPSPIPTPIRREAAQIITAFQQNLTEEELKEKILTLMEKEFDRKEQLFECIRDQAEAEGIVIENWDRQWAQYHYQESSYRFVQSLARWLDNN